MVRPSAKIAFENSRDDKRPITVSVEPWGEDYTLIAGEQLEIVATGTSEAPWFHVVEWGDDSQVYLEGDVEHYVVTQNGKPIQCGHSRDARPQNKNAVTHEISPSHTDDSLNTMRDDDADQTSSKTSRE